MKSKILRIIGVVATVAMIASALIAPVSAVTTPVLAVSTTTISLAATYTTTFNLGLTQPAAVSAIVLTFPTGSSLASVTGVDLTTGPGLATLPIALTHLTFGGAGTQAVISTTANTVSIDTTLLGPIGAGAIIQVVVFGVINPATVGSFSVSVKTAVETTAVASNTFTTTIPTPTPLPGITKLYNSAGILIQNYTGDTAIANAIAAVGGTGWKVEVYPGTFNAVALSIDNIGATRNGLTVIGVGAVGDIIVSADWSIVSTGVTLKNFTAKPATVTAVTVTATASGVVIDGLALTKSSNTTNQVMISYGNTVAASTGTIKNCAFTTGAGSAYDISINVLAGAIGLTVSTNTFAIDINENAPPDPTSYFNDIGVMVNASCTIDSNQFTTVVWGGTAINAAGGTATVTNNKFTGGLMSALVVNGATANVVFSSNTVAVASLSEALWPISTYAGQPITVYGNGTVTITQNDFSAAANQTILIWPLADASKIYVMFNSIATSNKYGITNFDTVHALNATHNYWGAVAGPAAGYNNAAVVTGLAYGTVNAANPLGTAVTGAKLYLAPGAAVTNGAVTVTNTTATLVGIASYAKSPTGVDVPSTVTAVFFSEVYVVGGADPTGVTFAGTTAAPITASSAVLIWNAAYGRWDTLTPTAVNTFANYITVSATLAQLSGTPMALVTVKPVVPAAVPAIVPPYMPITGTTNFPVDGTFSWAPVTGATGYDVVVAEDSTLADKFAVINYSASTTINASPIPADQTLKYDTIYWWRVRATNAVGPGPWTVGFFTTEKAPPAEVTPTTVATVTTTIPVVTSVPVPDITLNVPTQEPVNVIPPFLLWAVVAVGVILIIAVIVLIVRTRRIS